MKSPPVQVRVSLFALVVVAGAVAVLGGSAQAADAPVGLGTATPFSVLAGAGVTNTGPSVVSGDLGTCPTPAITGFPPGIVTGTIHANDATACSAKADLTTAYDDAAGRAPGTTFAGPKDLVGLTLAPGTYKSPSSLAITNTVTLDGQGDPNAVFIFQAASTLITATNSHVVLINSAQACNVFWQVGSSATLGVDSTFAGTIMALTSITANTNAGVQGRLLARNGATTLDSNSIVTACNPVTTTTTTTAGPGTPTTSTTTASGVVTSTTSTTSAIATPFAAAATTTPTSSALNVSVVTVPTTRSVLATTIVRTGTPAMQTSLLASALLALGGFFLLVANYPTATGQHRATRAAPRSPRTKT